MEFRKSEIMTWVKRAAPVLLGAAGGYAYYAFIGCLGDTCPITGNPWSSTAYGALIGFFLVPRSKPRAGNDGKE